MLDTPTGNPIVSALTSVSVDDETGELLAKCESYASKPGAFEQAFETAGSLQDWLIASTILSLHVGNDVGKNSTVYSNK